MCFVKKWWKLNIFPYLIDFLPFLLQVLSLYVYAILLKEFRHSMILGKSNTKVSEKYCRALVYNSVKTGSQLVWGSESLETRCVRDASRRVGPRAFGWATLENEKDSTLMAIRVGVNMLQFCFVSNNLSHTVPFQIKGEVHIFLKDCVARLYCVVVFCMHMYSCIYIMWLYNIAI